jgi:hypothetical protein
MQPIVRPAARCAGPEHDIKLLIKRQKRDLSIHVRLKRLEDKFQPFSISGQRRALNKEAVAV